MVTRIIVGLALGPAFLAALFFLSPAAIAVMVACIAAVASFELLRAAKVAHNNGMYIFTALAAALVPLGHAPGLGSWTTRAVAILLMAALFLPALSRYGTPGEIRFEHIIVCLFGGVGVPLFLSALVQLKRFDNGQFYVLLPVICAFTTDIGAYFAGVSLGRHKGVTKVSPNKSVEGYIGGFAAGVVFAVLYGIAASKIAGADVNLLPLVLCGLFGALATEVGDLSFSFVKRQYGVKDFGHLLPGHGGMLDRFDSMMFCGPVVLFIVQCLPVF